MRKIYFCLGAFLLCAPVWAQEKGSPQAQTWLEKNADQPYIALTNDYQTTLHPDWSYEESYHARVKIQKEEGKSLGQWPVYYNKSRDTIVSIEARVETPDGRQYPTTKIQDVQVYVDAPLYADMRMKVVTLPQVSVGSVIDVTVKSTISHKEIPNQFWAEILYPAIPTEHASHVFIVPEDKPLQFKAYKNDYKPTVEKVDGKIKYTFSFHDTDPIPDQEEFMPPLQEVLGSLYLSTIPDWKIIADWYRELVNKNTIDGVDVTVQAIDLTKDKTTQKDKARAILEFLQDNFRYVDLNFGDNAIALHQSNEILKNRYGDSKDISLLAKQMLKIAGIDTHICLFSIEFAGNPQNGLPDPAVFAHIILQMSLDGQNYFVDPQLKGFDFGQYPAHYDNASVMIIDNEAGYTFDHLPVSSQEDHISLTSQADITVHGDGSAIFQVHVKLPIEASQNFKRSWEASGKEDKDRFFATLQQNFAKGGKITDRKVTGITDRYGPVEFDLKYESPQAYPVVNNMILIKEEDQSEIPIFASDSRQYPIFVSNNSVIKNFNTYHLPEGFKVDSLPETYSLSSDLMDVSANYLKKDNNIEIDSAYHIKRGTIDLEKYNIIRDFRKELSKKLDQYVVLKKSSEISSEAKDWVKKQ